MVASQYFIWGCTSLSQQEYMSNDLLTYISRSIDFRLWQIFHGYDCCHRQILKLHGWSQVVILPEALPLWDQQGLLSFHGFMLRGGARGQYLGHHTFFSSQGELIVYQWSIRCHPQFHTWISLKPVGQSWSNFMCSITGVGEKAA